MKKYIYQGRIMDYAHDITGSVEISNDYNDQQAKHVELSGAQAAFYETNPAATVREVWEMQLEAPEPIAPEKIRENAYSSEYLIDWNSELRTCDFCRDLLSVYELTGNYEKFNQLKTLWLAARAEIQTKYPDKI